MLEACLLDFQSLEAAVSGSDSGLILCLPRHPIYPKFPFRDLVHFPLVPVLSFPLSISRPGDVSRPNI